MLADSGGYSHVFVAVSNNCFSYLLDRFFANDKNPYPLPYCLVLGSKEECVFSVDHKQLEISFVFEVLYTFTPRKSYDYFLNAEARDLVFLKTYNIAFDEIIISFTDLNDNFIKLYVISFQKH